MSWRRFSRRVEADRQCLEATPNAADISKYLPPPPAPEFDVAVIKPTNPDFKGTRIQISIKPNQYPGRDLLHPNQLKFEGPSGYLSSVLEALHVPVESQIAVFSKTSLQAPLIEPNNLRTIFFNDSVVVGWMKGGFIEIAALDPRQGVQFYKLEQRASSRPRFVRGSALECLRCHVGDATLDVAEFVVRSYTAADRSPMLIYGGSAVDHRTPIEDRWGGWFVTGAPPSLRHLANAVIGPHAGPKAMETLHGNVDSDVAALMVFDHQMHMANLIIRIGWDARAGISKPLTRGPPAGKPSSSQAENLRRRDSTGQKPG